MCLPVFCTCNRQVMGEGMLNKAVLVVWESKAERKDIIISFYLVLASLLLFKYIFRFNYWIDVTSDVGGV